MCVSSTFVLVAYQLMRSVECHIFPVVSPPDTHALVVPGVMRTPMSELPTGNVVAFQLAPPLVVDMMRAPCVDGSVMSRVNAHVFSSAQ